MLIADPREGAVQIKLSFSVHRNLNVRVNNDRGWDYTGANTQQPDVANGAPGGAPPVGAAGGINGLAVGPEDAPTGAPPPLPPPAHQYSVCTL